MVYFFTQLNSMLKAPPGGNFSRPQVLYCGPSNKSVDVIITGETAKQTSGFSQGDKDSKFFNVVSLKATY